MRPRAIKRGQLWRKAKEIRAKNRRARTNKKESSGPSVTKIFHALKNGETI